MPRELRRLLLHPVMLLALLLWAINDHYLKAAWHNAFTGKLSDVCSMMVAPVLLAAISASCRVGRHQVARLLTVWSLLMMLVMVSIKLVPLAADGYRTGLALLQWPFRCLISGELRPLAKVALAMDASDIWTLPCALVPLWLLARHPLRSSQRRAVRCHADAYHPDSRERKTEARLFGG